jgi:predicted aspartyl protease
MGSFYIGCKVENHKDTKKVAVVAKLLVDTGSEFTWLPGETLRRIGVEPQKKDIRIQMANGEILTRTVGFAVLRVEQFFTIDEVVFGEPGDMSLLGSRAMEGMNVFVDARKKKLVAAGPVVAATAIRPEVAKRMGIVIPGRKPAPSVKLEVGPRKKLVSRKPTRKKRF